MKIISSFVVTAFLLFACTEKPPATSVKSPEGERSAPESQPVQPATESPYAVEIRPKEATRKSILRLVSTGFELSNAAVEWLVDGRLVATPVPTQFDGTAVTKGATVQAKVTVQGREVWSNAVEIRNAPPEITRAKLLPEVFKAGDTFSVEAEGADPDGDRVTILYEWSRNGASAGKGSVIEGPVRRGDEIAVTAVPHDGETSGSPVVLTRKIQNMPPAIIEHQSVNFTGALCSYQAKAIDPDEDAVRFSLASAPEGMKIDPQSGELTWNVPPAFKGAQEVTIVADDGHGGTCEYRLTINIQGQ